MRELLKACAFFRTKNRITPACAGITDNGDFDLSDIGDHPRVCGNYACIFLCNFMRLGSPPRVRELLPGEGDPGDGRGITPACAGITSFPVSAFSFSLDHPRVCGNYMAAFSMMENASGSPPRVRELHRTAAA